MEVFRRIFEKTLAHERSRAAYKTRRACKKQILTLEDENKILKTLVDTKDCKITQMEEVVKTLNKQLESKKVGIHQLETELCSLKRVLVGRDKENQTLHSNLSSLHQQLLSQNSIIHVTKEKLEAVSRENDDQSSKMWDLLETNCHLNKRILELEVEAHSLEQALNLARENLQKEAERSQGIEETLRFTQTNFDSTSLELIEVSTRERQLHATVFNLRSELDQWKRNSRWVDPNERRMNAFAIASSVIITHSHAEAYDRLEESSVMVLEPQEVCAPARFPLLKVRKKYEQNGSVH